MASLMAGVSKAFPSAFAPKRVTGKATELCPVFWPSRVSGKLISSPATSPALASFRNLRRAFKSGSIDGDSTGSSLWEKDTSKQEWRAVEANLGAMNLGTLVVLEVAAP